jgi:hypothetical protein
MPTSHHRQISKIVEIVLLLRPQSVLDIGTGYGKYGILAREFLEFWLEDKPYEERKIRIDGIEAFPDYITAGHRYYYDEIHIGNALDIVPTLGAYDLILIIDVLEHFTEKDGLELLKQCAARGKHVLVSTPLDVGEQGAVFGNDFERHHFQWKKRHFRNFSPLTFFWNYHSLLLVIGQEGKRIKKVMTFAGLKIRFRSHFPGLYRFYRKKIRNLLFSE